MLKRLLIYSSVAILLGTGTNIVFNFFLNPDFNFFSKLAATSQQWAQKLRLSHPQTYVVTGGSSGRAGIDPQLLLDEYKIPLINACMGAGYGMDAIVTLAWPLVQPNDTLIINMEIGITTGENKKTIEPGGLRMLLREQGLKLYQSPFIPWSWENLRTPFLSDSTAHASYLVKRLTRPKNELYSYDKHAQVHPSGWMEVTRSYPWHYTAYLPADAQTLDAATITPAAQSSYRRILEACKKHQVRAIAMVPRQYAHESFRAYMLWFSLQLTRMGIPVLYDPLVGVVTTITIVTDTPNHLNAEGTRDNTRQLGESLKQQRFWSERELIEELRKRGWDDQGRKLLSH